jgi:hypothetical protein
MRQAADGMRFAERVSVTTPRNTRKRVHGFRVFIQFSFDSSRMRCCFPLSSIFFAFPALQVVARLTPRDGEDLAPLTYAEYSGVLEMLQSQLAAALGGDNASSSVEENLEAESARASFVPLQTWHYCNRKAIK